MGAVIRSPLGRKTDTITAALLSHKRGDWFRWISKSRGFLTRYNGMLYGDVSGLATGLDETDGTIGDPLTLGPSGQAPTVISSMAFGSGGEVYVGGTYGGNSLTARFDSGSRVWLSSTFTGGGGKVELAADGDILDGNGKLDAATGSRLWFGTMDKHTAYGSGSIATAVATLYLLDSSGSGTASLANVTQVKAIVTDGTTIFISAILSGTAGLYALNSSLSTVWSDTTISPADLYLDGSMLYACGARSNTWTGATGYANVWQLNKSTGAIEYTYDAGIRSGTASKIAAYTVGSDKFFHVAVSALYWPFRA